MADENVFRFISLRPARSRTRRRDQQLAVMLDRPAEDSRLGREIARAQRAGGRRPLADAAQVHRASDAYVRGPGNLGPPYAKLMEWADANVDEKLTAIDFESASQQLFGGTLSALTGLQAYRDAVENVGHSLLLDVLVPEQGDASKDWLVLLYKLLRLFGATTAIEPREPDETLGERLTRTLVLLNWAGEGANEPTEEHPHPQEQPAPTPERIDRSKLLERATALGAAKRELLKVTAKARAFDVRETDATEAAVAVRLTALEMRMAQVRESHAQPIPDFAEAASVSAVSGLRLARDSIARLSEPTRNVLRDLSLDIDDLNPTIALGALEEEIAYLARDLAVGTEPARIILMGGVQVSLKYLGSMFTGGATPPLPTTVLSGSSPAPAPSFTHPCKFMAGLGDLLLVKQTLKAYELGDFAHVENVLRGELRERDHRRLDLREEIGVTETERETEKERDLQSTERNELQNEATRTVREQTGLDAGMQLSGSYGPAVSFSSSLNASFASTTEEAQRKASSYSREVTEKTVEKIRERVREQRTIRTLQQIEERNLHRLDNATQPVGHVRGIYRWLNKIYDAQVVSYGQRMMMEFVIPEPAAFFLYHLVENPPQDLELVRPEPPTLNDMPLTPAMLTEGNYLQLLSQYHVTGSKPPPSSLKVMAYFDRQDGKERGCFGRGIKIAIPEGYEAYAALVSVANTHETGRPSGFSVMVGGQSFVFNNTAGCKAAVFGTPYQGEIAVIASLANGVSFAVGVDVACQLTTQGFSKWQHEMFDTITNAYLTQKAAYDEAVAAKKIQKGVEILGRNPLENRRIERDELKKLIVMMLTGSSSMNFNAFYPTIKEPLMNILSACVLGPYVRFFENAFEWNNILYVFYPYFWGRRARWAPALSFTDPDPDFAAFLKAGAVRVQLPVRPGFDRAVAHFLQFGAIWNGNDAPLYGDDLYVPVIQEITENLGKLDGGEPYPKGAEPWEVKVPTSLVLVQDLEEVPGIRDALTGNTVNIISP